MAWSEEWGRTWFRAQTQDPQTFTASPMCYVCRAIIADGQETDGQETVCRNASGFAVYSLSRMPEVVCEGFLCTAESDRAEVVCEGFLCTAESDRVEVAKDDGGKWCAWGEGAASIHEADCAELDDRVQVRKTGDTISIRVLWSSRQQRDAEYFAEEATDGALLKAAEQGRQLNRYVARAELLARMEARKPKPPDIRDEWDNLPDSFDEGIVPRGAR